MVDHTHEDIDQVFSKVSTQMMKTSVYNMEGMLNNVLHAVTVMIMMDYVQI